MTKQFDAFRAALGELCKAHDVQLAPSEFDSIQVWSGQRDAVDGIYGDCLQDRTDDQEPGKRIKSFGIPTNPQPIEQVKIRRW